MVLLSQTFKENIKLIKELQKKGVHTLLTWPSVVGDDCYNKKYNREIRIFSEEIRAFLEEQKIPVIGNIEDGQFSKKYFYNTFYHVLYDAKRIRTKRLIKEIERSKYSKWFNKNTTVALSNFEKLYELMRKKSEKIKKKSEIIFLSGWYDKESWGRWSHGEESSLLIFLAKEQVDKVIKLNINSRIYGANRKIFLRVEDKPVGFINLEGNKTLTLPTVSKGNNIITLQFQYFDVKSPSQTEENNSDGRQIKLGIESIKLITSD